MLLMMTSMQIADADTNGDDDWWWLSLMLMMLPTAMLKTMVPTIVMMDMMLAFAPVLDLPAQCTCYFSRNNFSINLSISVGVTPV